MMIICSSSSEVEIQELIESGEEASADQEMDVEVSWCQLVCARTVHKAVG